MKRLTKFSRAGALKAVIVVVAVLMLGGCIYGPDYGYVRGDGYNGDAYYGSEDVGGGYYGYDPWGYSGYGYGYGPGIGLGFYYDNYHHRHYYRGPNGGWNGGHWRGGYGGGGYYGRSGRSVTPSHGAFSGARGMSGGGRMSAPSGRGH